MLGRFLKKPQVAELPLSRCIPPVAGFLVAIDSDRPEKRGDAIVQGRGRQELRGHMLPTRDVHREHCVDRDVRHLKS